MRFLPCNRTGPPLPTLPCLSLGLVQHIYFLEKPLEEPQPIRPHPWSPQAGLAERWSGTGAHRKQARGQGGGSLQGKAGSLEPSRSSALDREAPLSLGPPRKGQSKEGGEGLRALEGSLSPLSAGNSHLWGPGRKADGHHGGLKPSAPWHAGQGTLPLGFSFTIYEQEYTRTGVAQTALETGGPCPSPSDIWGCA